MSIDESQDDLARIQARASQVWRDEVVQDWLRGPNSYLDGASPLDVLATRGPTEVFDALEAAAQGTIG